MLMFGIHPTPIIRICAALYSLTQVVNDATHTHHNGSTSTIYWPCTHVHPIQALYHSPTSQLGSQY